MINFAYLRQLVYRQRIALLGPLFVLVPLGLVVALFRPSTWQARQALVVRDEAIGDMGWRTPGRFDSVEQLKAAQELLLQFAKNRQVVEAALREVGPTDHRPIEKWPNAEDVEDLQRDISIGAPPGSELGKTELLYLSVKARTAARAVRLTEALSEQLEHHLQQLRLSRTASIVAELAQKVELAQRDLDQSTVQLQELEQKLGADLGELRTLTASQAGESNLRTSLAELQGEIRKVVADQTALEKQLEILTAAADDPEELSAAPDSLLEIRPMLRRLKDGLAEAQLRTAALLSKMQPVHPQVVAARQAEQEIHRQLKDELQAAQQSVQAELRVKQAVHKSLEEQLAKLSQRLDRLATVRAEYSNLVRQVEFRGEQLSRAQEALENARARYLAAKTASLITRVDKPDPGTRPLGPGRLTILAMALGGAIVLGIGLALLITPIEDLRLLFVPAASPDAPRRPPAPSRSESVALRG